MVKTYFVCARKVNFSERNKRNLCAIGNILKLIKMEKERQKFYLFHIIAFAYKQIQ